MRRVLLLTLAAAAALCGGPALDAAADAARAHVVGLAGPHPTCKRYELRTLGLTAYLCQDRKVEFPGEW